MKKQFNLKMAVVALLALGATALTIKFLAAPSSNKVENAPSNALAQEVALKNNTDTKKTPLASTVFAIQNGVITKDGALFVVKGVNIIGPNTPDDYEITQDAHLIADIWKFNLVRVNCNLKKTDNPYKQYTINNDLDKIVQTFTKKGVVVLIDPHEMLGGYYTDPATPVPGAKEPKPLGPSLTELKVWIADKARKYKDNPYVWFETMNEPGGMEGIVPQWLKTHQTIIKAIRETGNNSPILVEGVYWGQDSGEWSKNNVDTKKSAILSLGDRVLDFGGKKYSNIAFSIHAYDQYGITNQLVVDNKIADYLARVKAKGYAMIIGEYGVSNAGQNTTQAVQSMWKAIDKFPQTGRIVWTWHGGDQNDLTVWNEQQSWAGAGWGIDRKDGSKPGNLTYLGETAWDDNHPSDKGKKPVAQSVATPKAGSVDLVVTDIGVQEKGWKVGDTIHFFVTVKNVGSGWTSSAWLGTQFMVDGQYADFCGETTTLSDGQSRTYTSKGWKATKAGFKLGVKADYSNSFPEAKEENNELTKQIP